MKPYLLSQNGKVFCDGKMLISGFPTAHSTPLSEIV